jgi:hypothetical protein
MSESFDELKLSWEKAIFDARTEAAREYQTRVKTEAECQWLRQANEALMAEAAEPPVKHEPRPVPPVELLDLVALAEQAKESDDPALAHDLYLTIAGVADREAVELAEAIEE